MQRLVTHQTFNKYHVYYGSRRIAAIILWQFLCGFQTTGCFSFHISYLHHPSQRFLEVNMCSARKFLIATDRPSVRKKRKLWLWTVNRTTKRNFSIPLLYFFCKLLHCETKWSSCTVKYQDDDNGQTVSKRAAFDPIHQDFFGAHGDDEFFRHTDTFQQKFISQSTTRLVTLENVFLSIK